MLLAPISDKPFNVKSVKNIPSDTKSEIASARQQYSTFFVCIDIVPYVAYCVCGWYG